MDTKSVLSFLKLLKLNNNREWFEKNRTKYESAKQEFEDFINELIPAIRTFDKSIGTITAKECLFRIYRDVRFAKDKSPYKPNFGAYISNGGRKGKNGGYYIHFEHNGCFIAGGIWMPEPDILKAVRNEIYFNTAEFKKILNNKKFKEFFGELEGEKITRPPKDFSTDFPDIDLLKFKSYLVSKELDSRMLESKSLVKDIAVILKEIHPLNKFINSGIDLIEK